MCQENLRVTRKNCVCVGSVVASTLGKRLHVTIFSMYLKEVKVLFIVLMLGGAANVSVKFYVLFCTRTIRPGGGEGM